jgi:hypothetical protein
MTIFNFNIPNLRVERDGIQNITYRLENRERFVNRGIPNK